MKSTSTRIPATERRELILEAATRVFGERGYAAATTDQVAKAAGISQPYVVRMFGSKENLFVEVLERTLGTLMVTFTAAIEATDDPRPVDARMGAAYAGLIGDRGLLLSLMQGFILGHDQRIGPVARAGFMEVYRLLRERAGFSPEEARTFLAEGMLINTLLASGLTNSYGAGGDTDELLTCTFGTKFDVVMQGAAGDAGDAAGAAAR